MMAASARMSGTSAPVESNLNRGLIASWSCWARTDVRARVALTRRVRLAVTFFLARVSFWLPGVRTPEERVRLVVAADSAGRPTRTKRAVAQQMRARLNS